MTKELIDQLAKEHCSSYNKNAPHGEPCDFSFYYIEQLEAFAKAYQALPINNTESKGI